MPQLKTPKANRSVFHLDEAKLITDFEEKHPTRKHPRKSNKNSRTVTFAHLAKAKVDPAIAAAQLSKTLSAGKPNAKTLVTMRWDFKMPDIETKEQSRTYTLQSFLKEMKNANFLETLNDFGDTIGSDSKGVDKEWNPLDLTISIVNKEILEQSEFNSDIELYKRPEGAFFPAFNTTPMSLVNYQISSREDWKRLEIQMQEPCIIYACRSAMREAKVAEAKVTEAINKLKTTLNSFLFPRSKLSWLCKTIGCNLEVKSMRNENRHSVKKYKCPGATATIRLGLYNQHWFVNHQTDYTKFSVRNMDDCIAASDVLNFGRFGRRSRGSLLPAQGGNRYMDSFQLIRELDLLGYFETMTDDMIARTHQNNLLHKQELLLEGGAVTKPVTMADKKAVDDQSIFFFDTETTTNGDRHKVFMLCSAGWEGDVSTYKGEGAVLDWLDSLPSGAICYAHNLSYDIRVIMHQIRTITRQVIKGSRVYSLQILHKGKKIEFRDSYALITSPLRGFPKMFGGKLEKEIMPYSFYTEARVQRPTAQLSELKGWSDYHPFVERLDKLGLRDGDIFHLIEYARYYCEIDVKVLRHGVKAFREMFLTAIKMDPLQYLTISSISHAYMVREGCFDGVLQLSGCYRAFVQKCVLGGRVMTNQNKVWHVKQKLNDFDAVSLYPSAMSRLGRQGMGYPIGAPKKGSAQQLNYEFLEQQSCYFAKILIRAINTPREMPLNYRRENGSICYNNEPGAILHVDSIYLNDLITYQGIEYEILEAVYFDQGFNDKVSEVIEHMFEQRLQAKRVKNPIQAIYKLLMNSGYGKTCQKESKEDLRIIKTCDLPRFLLRNYSKVNYCEPITEALTLVRIYQAVSEHYNTCHVGALILSMSKRIMHEVMCLAEDNKMRIFYQDTDSMHIRDDQVSRLSDLYRQEHKRELVGKGMGQFHCDFDLGGADSPVSWESYFLGKKVYIDYLRSMKTQPLMFKGQLMQVPAYGFHVRMKGVGAKFVDHPWDTFKKLYEGQTMTFDLLSGGGVKFDCSSLGQVVSKSVFTRKLAFSGERVEA